MLSKFVKITGCDTFLLFYMKRRIEQDGQIKWTEPFFCFDDNPSREWIVLEEAAILVGAVYRLQIEDTIGKLLEATKKIDFEGYREILCNFLNLVGQRQMLHLVILALIALAVAYSRKLSELEFSQDAEQTGIDDYGKIIYEFSLYAPRVLTAILEESGGKWEGFCLKVVGMWDLAEGKFDNGGTLKSIILPACFGLFSFIFGFAIGSTCLKFLSA